MSRKKQKKDNACGWCLKCAHYGYSCSTPIPMDAYGEDPYTSPERPDCYEYDRPE